jgi:hypothetical protein
MYNTTGCVGNMLQMELASLVGTGAATLKFGIPTMCNGANIFYQKSAFFECGGYGDYASHPSGDDEFILHNMCKKFFGKVMFLKNLKSIVFTKPPETFNEFVNQRIRWASKWKTHIWNWHKSIAVFIFIINTLSIILGLSWVLGFIPWQTFASTVLIKILSEFLFLRKVLKDMAIGMNVICFILAGLIYPFYAISFGILANLMKPEWKLRKVE